MRTESSGLVSRSRAAWQPLAALGLLLLAIVGFLVVTAGAWPYTLDDAFITFRYAENLARGCGLSFNPAPPVPKATPRCCGRS